MMQTARINGILHPPSGPPARCRRILRIYDVNGDSFEIRGLGYPDPAVIPMLEDVNAAYDPDTIHRPTDAEYKELKTGRRRPWAEDRVM